MKDIDIIELIYDQSIQNFYKSLSELPGFVALESTDKCRGRYDIVSAFPYETFIVDHDDVTLIKLQEKLKRIDYGIDLPFQGGAIGYFSYDLACSRAKLRHQRPSLMAMPLAIIGLYDWAIITDHHLKKVIVFSANTQDDTPEIIKLILDKWKHSKLPSPSFSLLSEIKPLIDKKDYSKSFKHILNDIKKGRCYQINYTQPFQASYTGNAWAMYTAIKTMNPVPFSAYLSYEQGKILSFSPERFLLMDKGKLLTSPIKGSCKRALSLQEDATLGTALINSEKNRAENVMIVDLLRNDLGKIAKPGSVNVEKLFSLESYEKIHHLVSHISAECREDISPFDAFLSCFPGGSITGAPKLEAMEVISEQELYSRGVYCGNIGYFSDHGRFDTNIAIRTMITKEQQIYLAAGGGIVFDSTEEDEYAECFTKIAAIIKGLNKACYERC